MTSNLDGYKEKRNNKHKRRGINHAETPWDSAIREAKRRIAELRFSIKDFEKRKKRGDKWLGVKTA